MLCGHFPNTHSLVQDYFLETLMRVLLNFGRKATFTALSEIYVEGSSVVKKCKKWIKNQQNCIMFFNILSPTIRGSTRTPFILLNNYRLIRRLTIDGLLFQCFELPCACTDFFAVKTLHFTYLSIKLLSYSKTMTV